MAMHAEDFVAVATTYVAFAVSMEELRPVERIRFPNHLTFFQSSPSATFLSRLSAPVSCSKKQSECQR